MFMALTVLVLSVGVARAEEGLADCKSPAFKAALRLKSDFPFDCTEIARLTPPVDGGRWTIRALRSASTPEGYVQAYAEDYLAAAQAAFTAWEPYVNGIGLTYGNVSFVFTDPQGSEVDFKSFVLGHGHLVGAAHANGFSFPQDCVVSVNMEVMSQLDADTFAPIAAHELFHCVQSWSLPKAALNPGQGAQSWSQEGSANFFAALAAPQTQSTEIGATAFLGSIGKKPLTQQAYDATIFFAYLAQTGMPTLAAFFQGLATEPGEAAQQKAAEAALGPKVLNGFARALADGTIALPSGYQFPAPDLPEAEVITDTVDLPTATLPFTVELRQLSFVKAEFAAADGKLFQVRAAEGGDWSEFPTEIKPKDCAVPVDLLATRFVTTKPISKMGLPITVMKTQDCVVCTALAKMDQCMVGMWQLNRDDHLSWLQKQAVDMTDVRFATVGGDIFLTLKSDGTAQWMLDGFQVGAVYEPAELAEYDIQIEIDVAANAVLDGAWSTDDQGGMNYCGRGAVGDFTSTVRIPDMGPDQVAVEAPVEDMYLSYTCGGQTATMTYGGPAPIPGDFPEWRLERVK
jgi:hypothetical protein